MASRNQVQDVKKIIMPLRAYLNENLSINVFLLTALQDKFLIDKDAIKQWKSLLDRGKENEVRYALVDYLQENYTYNYLERFTDLLIQFPKDQQFAIWGEIAQKLNIAMGRDSSQQESAPPVVSQQQLKVGPQQDGDVDVLKQTQEYNDTVLKDNQ